MSPAQAESPLIQEARTAGWVSPWDHPLLRGVGRLSIYRLLRRGAIESRKLGGKWRTTDAAVVRYVDGLREGQGSPGNVK